MIKNIASNAWAVFESGNYAFVFVHEAYRMGTIAIHSNKGNFGYTFNLNNDERFFEFLADIEMDYFLDKISGDKLWVFGLEETINQLKLKIIGLRRSNDFSKGMARMHFEELNDVKTLEDLYILKDSRNFLVKDINPAKTRDPNLLELWKVLLKPFLTAYLNSFGVDTKRDDRESQRTCELVGARSAV